MLDNDELIATRKLHGQDDGLYEETSDKNVVTEEDLEELNEVLLHHRETEQVRIAIKHILSELKQKDKRIQELERENASKQKAYDDCYCNYKHYKQFESIPVRKVKDLKESIILKPTIIGGRRNAKTLEYGIKLGKIKACEELLEENK